MNDTRSDTSDAEGFDLESYVPFQLALISSLLRDELDKSCITEVLRIDDWRVMTMIANKPGIVASDIVRIARLSEVSVHRSIMKMVELNLVERVSGDKDRRQKLLILTEMGWGVYSRLIPDALRLEKLTLELLPVENREIVLEGIRHLFKCLMNTNGVLANPSDADLVAMQSLRPALKHEKG